MITVAPTKPGANSNAYKMRYYKYHIRFECRANDIQEADACFLNESKLAYDKSKPGWMCPLVTVEITNPPTGAGEAA